MYVLLHVYNLSFSSSYNTLTDTCSRNILPVAQYLLSYLQDCWLTRFKIDISIESTYGVGNFLLHFTAATSEDDS